MFKLIRILSILSVLVLAACSSQGATQASDTSKHQAEAKKVGVAFDADSAYSFVAQQVAFGPRVPNTQAHRKCGDWLVEKLKLYGASDVSEQRVQLEAYTGTKLDARNISASFNPQAQKRILLLSHWDSRPWADQDSVKSRRLQPIDGANDGASGIGVILEIARNLALNQPRIGVDVLFVDAEDYGQRDGDADSGDSSDTWCLGSGYWAQNPTLDVKKIRYAILLDMVGGKDAVFPREYFSQYKFSDINDRVWRAASDAGYGARFTDNVGTPVMDDHIPLIQAGIPAIDIIETMHPATQSFNPTWHTHADNMDNIDKETLKAVGQTLIQLIYTE